MQQPIAMLQRPSQPGEQCSRADMLVLVSQELLRPSDACAEELVSTENGLSSIRAPDSEDAGLVSEYAYALKCGFADTFAVELHNAELKEALLLCNGPTKETTSATPSLSNT